MGAEAAMAAPGVERLSGWECLWVGGRVNRDNAESSHFPILFFLVFAVEV